MARSGVIVAIVLLTASSIAAQMTGYSVDDGSGPISTFSCPEGAPPACYYERTELGTLDGLRVWATTMAPTGELVVWDGNTHELVEVEVPSLTVLNRIGLDLGSSAINGLAFDEDGLLWATYFGSLYTVDLTTGEAALAHQLGIFLDTIAFVGHRLFGAEAYGSTLYEIDPLSGVVRIVAVYDGYPAYGMTQLVGCNGRLWGLVYIPSPPPGPTVSLATHDLETGEIDMVGPFADDWDHTLALTSELQQPVAAVPNLGWPGVVILVLLMILAAAVLVRRGL